MRPQQLTMTAFGPFPGSELIDFTRLGENPLFLINGPTGSGKTTILDALCFALYGKTTGDERDGSQMRCDLALVETLTEVILEFELAGSRYRIRRLPEQPRLKARGEGTTSQAPEAQLYQLLADGSEKLLVARKVNDATAAIENLTGLSVDQFRQVMVLPQGKFRQLLLAESAEREKIFSQLFQTRIYKRLEDSLKERSAIIRRERDDLKKLQQGILEGADLATPEELIQELQDITPQVEQAAELKHEREQHFIASGNRLQQAQALRDEFRRLAAVSEELAQLQHQKPQIDDLRQQLAAAEQAARLQPAFAEKLRCQTELQQVLLAVAEADAQQQKYAQQLREVEAQQATAQGWHAALDAAKQQAAQLSAYRVRADQLAALRRNLAAAQQQAVAAELQLQYQQLAKQSALHQQFTELQRHYGQQAGLLEQKKARGISLGEQFNDLEQQAKTQELIWHRGQAAILAVELEEGQPCPVCGSAEHPAPARSAQRLPSQQQVEQARSAAQTAQAALQDARDDYDQERSKLRELHLELERLRLQLTAGAERQLDEITSELQQIQAQARGLQIELPDLQQRLKVDLIALQQRFAQATNAALTAATQVTTAEQELPADFRQPGSLDQAEQACQQQIRQLENQIKAAAERHQQALGQSKSADASAAAAQQQQRRIADALQQAKRSWQATLQASPFATEPQFQQALLGEQEYVRLKTQSDNYAAAGQRLAGAQQQLLTSLGNQQQPDLAGLERQLNAAETEKTAAVLHWQQLDKRLSLLSSTRAKLAKAATDQAELDRQYAIIGTLSDVANGQTGNKISLQRFVLSVLLDDVLIEASHRLSLMSKGRYRLLRKEDRAKRNKASGLELEVEDAYTGKLRSVATLSGGESFMAALALALGLSDVVQAYAGGIRLDTLFIDEGFGSLDPESLDLAIRALIDLQATGRMIGIISHVAELKEQLPLRIDVLTDRLGSHTRLVTA